MGTQDEATFGLIPIVQRGWARRGSHPVVTINHSNKYTNVFGARSKKTFVFAFNKRKRAREFVKFLEILRRRWKKYLLFVDNAKAHQGKHVRNYLEKHVKTIKLEYFPGYSPETNPTEQCWKPARKNSATGYSKVSLQQNIIYEKHSMTRKLCQKCSII